LADDDWYSVTVPPNRRMRVTAEFSPGQTGLFTEIRTPAGGLAAKANGFDGSAGVDATAGPDGATLLVHVYASSFGAPPPSYGLGVVEADLLALKPGRTRLLTLSGDARTAFRVVVNGPHAARGAKLRIVARDVKGAGTLADVRVTSPTGRLVSPFGDGRTDAGTNVVVTADEPGAWIVEVTPRDGTSGPFSLPAPHVTAAVAATSSACGTRSSRSPRASRGRTASRRGDRPSSGRRPPS